MKRSIVICTCDRCKKEFSYEVNVDYGRVCYSEAACIKGCGTDLKVVYDYKDLCCACTEFIRTSLYPDPEQLKKQRKLCSESSFFFL